MTHNFAIDEHHLENWAGLKVNDLKIIGRVKLAGKVFSLRRSGLLLHRNAPGKRDELSTKSPYALTLPEGVVVYPRGEGMRLPVLGLRALLQNDLRTVIDFNSVSISARRADAAPQGPVITNPPDQQIS
jgi:hypothetical protein